MSKITENVTKALQSIELAKQDLTAAYRESTDFDRLLIDHVSAQLESAKRGLDMLVEMLELKE